MVSFPSALVSLRLDGLCERLVFGGIETVLEPQLVCGESVRHNMTQLTARGVVKVTDGHPEDLPNWILTAMKCLAQCGCLCVYLWACVCMNGWMDICVMSVLC